MSEKNEDPRRASDDGQGTQELRRRTVQCMVVPLPSDVLPADVEPCTPESLFTQLDNDPEMQTHKRIAPPGAVASGTSAAPEVTVVKMPPHRAAALVRDPRVHIERDHHLRVAAAFPDGARGAVNPGVQLMAAPVTSISFLVTGKGAGPLSGATVVVMSPEGNFQSATGPDGRTTLNLTIHDLTGITAVYVKPAGDYWERYQDLPALSTTKDNEVELRPLTDTFPALHERQVRGWGLAAMGLDQIPPNYRGQGVKVAIIDSGCAAEHPDLSARLGGGVDLIDGEESGQWTVDVIGHGTHCAGVVASSDNAVGVFGIVPEAEVHVCKVFPGGRYSGIIEALGYCVQNSIDVVNLSMGSDEPSALLSQAIDQARQAGVACIVAAGNSGGRVQYPGRLPSVLTVAALGKLGQFPEDTFHAQQVMGQPDQRGFFSAAFTCYGPEVDVCAPGVAILSTVPERGYAVWDGTSMATPHVTGLAALVLAHHPDFRNGYQERDGRRVDRLFELIKSSCDPMDFGDPARSGAGLPNAARALALSAAVETVNTPELAQLREAMQNAGLLTATGSGAFGPLDDIHRLLQAAGLLSNN
ncbi:S8 family peptidase [Streptomyces sp. NY05-11A]|uniref:S8 family peptidase n=1 Tax=Streptomyces soliscabiei TaxID=588897 RepID=UPI0029AAED2F|nr:S8 family peptidase [Streptomyces sp. NY05-11A]MDX2679943.1 S8 family peptidase [Streptomyces sp. NY05-11A]